MGREMVVPLFPLPGTVVFPGLALPFYVFEPRYRAMLAHALDGRGLVGIPRLREGFEASYEGAPPFHPIFGTGSIEHYVTHADGTSHIVVLGRWKVRLVEELAPLALDLHPGAPFRQARVEVLEDAVVSDGDRSRVRDDVLAAWRSIDPDVHQEEVRKILDRLAADEDGDPVPVLHLLCTLLVRHPSGRQRLLECEGAGRRSRALVAEVHPAGLAAGADEFRDPDDDQGRNT